LKSCIDGTFENQNFQENRTQLLPLAPAALSFSPLKSSPFDF
jgi:hypothetical protein